MSKLEPWHSLLVAIGLACLLGLAFLGLICAAAAAGFASAAKSRPTPRVIEVEQSSQAASPLGPQHPDELPRVNSQAKPAHQTRKPK